MTNPAFKDPWPKDWKALAEHMEQFQEEEIRQINLERDRKALLDTIDRLKEANDLSWLMCNLVEVVTGLK